MNSLTLCYSLAFILLFSSTYCHEHHNNDRDDKWSVFVSHIQSFWKTEPSESQTESFVPTKTTLTEKDPSQYYHHHINTDDNSKSHTPKIEILNGTARDFESVKEGVTLGLAWIISLPIVGIIVLCCCCYCCCKCCASMCGSDDKVVVMQQNVVAPPQQPQVIVQQPIIQNMQAPRDMQQFPPQNPQWGHPNYHQQPMPPPYYPTGGVDNPNFQYPTAPNHMPPDNKY